MRVPVLLCVLLCVSAAPGPVSGAGADKSCTDLRQFYTGKGFTLVEVPQTEISGEFCRHLTEKKPQHFIHLTTLTKSVFTIVYNILNYQAILLLSKMSFL